MRAIVSADANWGIGYKNKLLISIPSDMRFFRDMTTGHVVVMGRKTLESLPGNKPLSNRVNIVLTSNQDYKVDGATVVHSVEELNKELESYPTDEVFCIGGASVYKELLPLCNTAYVTRIDFAYRADAHFPNLDLDLDWVLAGESEEQTCFDIEFKFMKYVRR